MYKRTAETGNAGGGEKKNDRRQADKDRTTYSRTHTERKTAGQTARLANNKTNLNYITN